MCPEGALPIAPPPPWGGDFWVFFRGLKPTALYPRPVGTLADKKTLTSYEKLLEQGLYVYQKVADQPWIAKSVTLKQGEPII